MKKTLIALVLLASACAPVESISYRVICHSASGDVIYEDVLYHDRRGIVSVWEDRDGHAVTVPEGCVWIEVSE